MGDRFTYVFDLETSGFIGVSIKTPNGPPPFDRTPVRSMLSWFWSNAGLPPKGGVAMVKFTVEVDALTVTLLVLTLLALSATR